MNKLIAFSFFLFTLSNVSFGQTCEKVLFSGKVIDSLQPQSFYNLMIINRRTGQAVFGQPNGSFSIYVMNGDSLTVSVKNYATVGLRAKADSNCQFINRIYLERLFSEIREVTVRPLKSLQQIKEERADLALRETRLVTGIEVMQSPITALYQAFSKKEQNKRWIAEQEYKDNQRQVVKELLRNYVAYDIIDLTEEDFDEFVSFLNVNEDFLKTATEMELVTFIKDKFDHFRALKNLQISENTHWRTTIHTDKEAGIEEMLKMYCENKAIDLPKSEIERFIVFMNADAEFLQSHSDLDVFNFVQAKYYAYIDFYSVDIRASKDNFNLTEADNEDWKWDLKHKNKKTAVFTLLKLYNEHKVIQIDDEELDRFIIFLNLKEDFMNTASNDELIKYVREKYFKYLDFYRK